MYCDGGAPQPWRWPRFDHDLDHNHGREHDQCMFSTETFG